MQFGKPHIEIVPVVQRQGGNDVVKCVVVSGDIFGAADPPLDMRGFGAGEIEHFL